MSETQINIVTKFPPETTSLNNLCQGISEADESWNVHIHQLQRPQLPGQNKMISGVEYGILTLQIFWIGLKLRWKTDILVTHKPLPTELIEAVFGIITSDRVFHSFDNTVHATFDANYVSTPKKSAFLFQRADFAYVTSREIEQEVKKHTSEDCIALIPPSIDTELFTPENSEVFDSDDKLVLGWVGAIEPHKENLRLFADSLDAIETKDIKVKLLYGDGEFPPNLKQKFLESGVEIDLIDPVPHEEVPAVINSFDIGVAPLRDTAFNRGRSSEKIREYMACGVPVIASDIGENPYLVPEGTGFLVNDPSDWQNALQTLSDPQVRNNMGVNARNFVVENFSIPVISKKIRLEFQKLV